MPDWALIRQQFDLTRIDDPAAAVRAAFAQVDAQRRITPQASIAITAGSRGVDAIVPVLRAVAAGVRALGATPFLSAAMGSHGGATGEGQREVLRGYGITEDAVGCEIRSSMDVVALGTTEAGVDVFCDRQAFESGGIIVVGRVKPHSILTGDLGSGLLKMSAIGLGKRHGADALHTKGLQSNLVAAARVALARAPIVFGIALVENAHDRLALLEGVPPEEFEAADCRLLARARAYLPQIPFDPLDVLIVDEVGKNISGAGMDPNVIGMWRRIGGVPDRSIARIVALDLTDESHGNAVGVGMADIITQRLRSRIDEQATYMNAATSGFLAGAKIPLTLPSAREAIDLACKPFDPRSARIVRIEDTAHLEYLQVSPALLLDVAADARLEIVAQPCPLQFDAGGELVPLRPAEREG
ncbi:DUF2088 domain-containing protein [bacterium]|nr:MAG: DUF2088 domain-containing protein [bacterium]